MDIGLPYTALIESLEIRVQQGLFTAWACAHQNGIVSAFYADEAAPEDWYLDQKVAHSDHENVGSKEGKPGVQSTVQYWLPAFDLASLTKPLLANAWLRLTLGADPVLWCQSPLASLIEPRNLEGTLLKSWCEAHPRLTLAHVLNHTSGLRAWTWFGRALWESTERTSEKNQTRLMRRTHDLKNDSAGEFAQKAQCELTTFLLRESLTASQSNEPSTLYSDLNYYLLARVIENISIVQFRGWNGVISELNELWKTQFWHASLDPERSQSAIPFFPYLHSQVVAHIYEQRKLFQHVGEFGAVHDTNANILATEFRASSHSSPIVSSHAGFFGNIFDLIKTIPFLIETQADFASLSVPENQNKQRFHWGLDTPSNHHSSAGLNQWASSQKKSIFGHLGFTGTSLWMADDGQFHILLTNRTAQRRMIGSSRVPRVLIFHKDSNTEPLCWISRSGSQANSLWQPIHWTDAYALCFEHNRASTRYWDRTALRKPPDLLEVRRTTGQLLWTH